VDLDIILYLPFYLLLLLFYLLTVFDQRINNKTIILLYNIIFDLDRENITVNYYNKL
jgi:hypothetical protein